MLTALARIEGLDFPQNLGEQDSNSSATISELLAEGPKVTQPSTTASHYKEEFYGQNNLVLQQEGSQGSWRRGLGAEAWPQG
jgi:hypothetical protein